MILKKPQVAQRPQRFFYLHRLQKTFPKLLFFLNNSYKYNNDSFIIFICTFDAIVKNIPVYTFENICLEDKSLSLQEGTKKIIINAEAFKNTKNEDLKEFLEYLKTGKAKNQFTRRIEEMIHTIKNNEQARQEYRLMSTFEMDARDKGFSEGIKQTAKILKQLGDSTQKIMQVTGLSESEIEAL